MDVAGNVNRFLKVLALVLALPELVGCMGGDLKDGSATAPAPTGHADDSGEDSGAQRTASEPTGIPAASLDAGATAPAEPNFVEGQDDCPVRRIDIYEGAPDMLIVLDRSLSMSLNHRWEPSKQAVKSITRDFGGLLRFGMSVFPGAGGDCSQGRLDVPLEIDSSTSIAEVIDETETSGLTPTGPALTQALRELGDRRPGPDMSPSRPGYVLLVTDGEPNCQVLPIFPDTAQQDAARAAVRALRDKNIATYVIGYQIDASSQSLMNELAQLGGTSRYRAVESGEQIVSTFRDITKDVVKCNFDLAEAPDDPRKLRVELDETAIPLGASDGWTIQGKSVTLQGAACAKLKDGRGHTLSAQLECTEVVLD